MQSRRITIAVGIGIITLATLAAGSAGASSLAPGEPMDLGPTAAGVADAQNGTAEPTGTAESTGTAWIYESAISVNRGDVATLRVHLENTTEATVVLGDEGVGENVTVTVTDGNGDGVVPLEFHTGAIGMERTRFVPADEGDDYGTLNASDVEGTLDAGDYPIDVYAGHGVAGEPTGVATLVVTESAEPPETSFVYEGDALTMHPQSGQVVEATTELEPGRNVTVRLRSSGENPFLKTREVAVGDEGGFSVTFDLSDVQAPANGTASVTVDGEQVAEGDVEIGEAQETTAGQEETSTPGMPGFGVGVTLVGLSIVTFLARRARR